MHIDEALKELLQQEIVISSKGRNLVDSKLILFDRKAFNVRLHLESGRVFNLPYPYRVDKSPGGFTLNYTLSSVLGTDVLLNFRAKNLAKNTRNRFYDTKASITIHAQTFSQGVSCE